MELGIFPSDFLFFLLLSVFFSLLLILPSDALHLAGFTIPKIFVNFLGDERLHFVEYHLRRTLLTAFIHSAIPFLCFVGLGLSIDQPVFSHSPNNFIQWLSLFSLLIVAASIAILSFCRSNNYERHPLVHTLRNLSEDQNWQTLAREIDDEVRAPLLFTILYKDCSRVLVTRLWLIKVTNYAIQLAPISDSQFLVIRSTSLQNTLSDQQNHPGLVNNMAQSNDHIIDVQIRSISGRFKTFQIRVRSQQELDNLRDQLGRPIGVLDSLVLPQPMHELFVDAFLTEIRKNPRVTDVDLDELEPCFSCSQTIAQVKLVKRCVDSVEQSEENCRSCACKPNWCARCMGRIFASKQNQQMPEIWMAGRAPCPTCRATFCVLDVCLLEQKNKGDE
ncbi:hypothetical protein niasHS_007473 [Heterodera schachtii]|uniref:Transmembrane protein n=1 Tax=Heterodera schachtii TaxID=97005 RepID=A0ABD2JXR5_HETSC